MSTNFRHLSSNQTSYFPSSLMNVRLLDFILLKMTKAQIQTIFRHTGITRMLNQCFIPAINQWAEFLAYVLPNR